MSEDHQSHQFRNNALNGLESLVVLGMFLAIYNIFGELTWAILVATIGSLWVAYSRYRRGLPIGKFLPIVTALIVARGIAGIVTNSEDVYFGFGIVQSATFGVVLIISAAMGRSLLMMGAPYIFDFPKHIQEHPIYIKTINTLTYVGGLYFIARATFDVWLLGISTVNEYVIIRTIVGYPLSLIVFWSCVAYSARRFSKIPQWEGFMGMMERQTVIYKEIFATRFKRTSKSGLESETVIVESVSGSVIQPAVEPLMGSSTKSFIEVSGEKVSDKKQPTKRDESVVQSEKPTKIEEQETVVEMVDAVDVEVSEETGTSIFRRVRRITKRTKKA